MICFDQTNSLGTRTQPRLQYSVRNDFRRPEALPPHNLTDTQLRPKHILYAANSRGVRGVRVAGKGRNFYYAFWLP